MLKVYEGSYQNYGAPKTTQVLKAKGIDVAEKTVGDYMRQLGIKTRCVKFYTKTTTAPNFSDALQNILGGEFGPAEPDAAWCSDTTYIWTCEGFVGLTSIMDLFSRKIIA